MPVGIRYQRCRKQAVQIYPADEDPPIVGQAKTVAATAITQNNRSVPGHRAICAQNVERGYARTRSLDPGFNREVLQLQVGRISEIHPVPVDAVEYQRLADNARIVGYRSRSCDGSIVAIRSIVRVAF